MKKFWIILILLIVIASIVGLLIYLNQEAPFEQDRTLYNFEDNTVEEIHIVSEESEVLFIKEQDGWVMKEPKPYKIDASMINSLESRLKDFLASRIIEDDSENLQSYGLDNPAATISFKLDDGTQNTLLIGDMTASKVQYYAKDASRDNIYILGSYDVENFLRPVSEFRDRTILTVDTETINMLSLDIDDKRDFKLVGEDSGQWRIVEPLKTDARNDALGEIIGDILKLKIKDFIAETAQDFSQYGLDTPAYTLEIGDDKQNSQIIYFGKIDEDKQIAYIKLDAYDEVYTLSLEAFDPRRFKIANFLNEAPLSVAIVDINKVTIIENDLVTEFAKITSDGEERFTYLGKAVSQEDFITLYVNIMALTAEGYDTENSGGTPALTVILELDGISETIKAEFVKRDELSYYMVINGEPRPFYIGERKVDLIKWWRDRILEGE